MKLSIEDVHDNGAYIVEARGTNGQFLTALTVLIHGVAIITKLKPKLLLTLIEADMEINGDALNSAMVQEVDDAGRAN